MISFPNAKINLGLHVLSKRPDGFHEIESCIYPVELHDVLEIIESNEFRFQSSGLPISGKESNNLVIKAYRLLADDFKLPAVQIHLHKIIPMGAGLGGGSSDAAFALKMINELFDLKIDHEKLAKYAAILGSDCPFFIQNQPVIVTGTGTSMKQIDLDLSSFRIELKHPQIHVSTADAYGMVTSKKSEQSIATILGRPIIDWKDDLINDFEAPMLSRFSEIAKAKKDFYNQGALYASMTGSGSSVFGIFHKS